MCDFEAVRAGETVGDVMRRGMKQKGRDGPPRPSVRAYLPLFSSSFFSSLNTTT